jgi:glyoxylase-like metal-dependent hydrolase (beta-lactamase superfamily II)
MPLRERLQLGKVQGARVGRYGFGISTTFIVYRIGETLIDSGPPNQWKSVRTFMSEAPVHTLLLSHHHEDHGGNAGRIARHCQLTPLAPELGRKKLATGYRTPLLQRIIWGSPLPVSSQPLPETVALSDGTELISVHTPGHAEDHHCFFMPEMGWLFSGDLYLSKTIRYFRADENLSQLIESIGKILLLDFDTIFCAHRGILKNGKEALSVKLANILELCARTRELYQQGQSVEEIVKQLLGPEDMLAWLSNPNFSKANLISEALKVKP